MAIRIAQALGIKLEELYKVYPQHYEGAIFYFHIIISTFYKVSTKVNNKEYIYHTEASIIYKGEFV